MSVGNTSSPVSDPVRWRSFVISITLILLVFCLGLFLGMHVRSRQLIENQMYSEAKAHFNSVVLTRRWNAGHGGVFVEKRPGVRSNPYLENPDIATSDGVVYTKKNPALMTREISELAGESGLFQFHITSLNPLNPGNQPDDAERTALKAFEDGARERVWRETIDGKTYYRYMAPLMVEKSCLPCHKKQGYQVGDIRGGISVRFDIDEMQAAINRDFAILMVVGIGTLLVLLVIIYYLIFRLIRTVRMAQARIRELAITDELTGIANRRAFFERMEQELERSDRYEHPMALLILDLDHFKQVNDKHGHLTGDLVLRRVGHLLSDCLRSTDLPARYGGEEFACILPHTGLDGANQVAERIRVGVQDLIFEEMPAGALKVTVSVGGTVWSGEDESVGSVEDVVALADQALYKAKAAGRNRVVFEKS